MFHVDGLGGFGIASECCPVSASSLSESEVGCAGYRTATVKVLTMYT